MKQDMLNELFTLQEELQRKLHTDVRSQEFYTIMTIALIDELMESLRETPWKPWKKQQKLNRERLQQELIDAWHFMINLSIAAGLSSKKVHKAFIYKNKINIKRHQNEY